MRCEDYPCCGHTDLDPCERQPYDEPGFYDTSRPGNEHALCEHEYGICDVEPEDDYDANDDGEDSPFVMEDQHLDTYMEDRISDMYG